MDFFQSQDRAKRNTTALVFLFAVGVIATMASVHLLLAGTVGHGRFGDPRFLLWSVGGVAAVVGLGTLVKFAQMSHGGRAVAEALGGRLIDPGTADPSERRVLNVVEEMAIASGVRVPPVYIMDDAAINAFAAGNSEKDAVIGVTRGCIDLLSRDELQGVMAHEFSHIFHRDMRLNMHLVGWLGGIFAVSMIGRILLNSMRGMRASRNGKGDGRALVAVLGIGLFLIGIVGYFFGRVIQAAVSRQREFLADASAVQYTRNPEGIAGALEKIGAAGSRLAAPAAAEFSHFLFANGIASLFSTHPPLEERIRRIRGVRLGLSAAGPTLGAPEPVRAPVAGASAALAGSAGLASAPRATEPPVHAERIRASRDAIGTVSPASVEQARAVIASAPTALVAAARDPFSARAVVFATMLQDDRAARAVQLAALRSSDAKLAAETERLASAGRIRAAERLPLLELAAASLAALSPAQYAAFRTALAQFIAADGQVDRLEWTVRVLLRHAVEGRSAAPHPSRRATDDDVSLVASVLAWSGASDRAAASRAWSAARGVDARLGASPVDPGRCTLDALDASLRAIAGAPASVRRRTVDACVACVCADGITTAEEAELLRAVSASVGAPMPVIAPAA